MCKEGKRMSKEPQKSNLELAQEEANKIDLQIIDTLQKGYNFRVEAGAGSGKTYSLNKVIEWIQVNKWKQYRKKNQHVVCITYTNAAVDVISGRLANDSFIIPSTIHSFAWNAIKQYQSTLIKFISEDETFRSTEGDFFAIRKVEYTLGHRYNENGIMYLYHDDVIRLFAALLDNAKFRRVFSDKYPLILIDEYQDSLKPIIDRFLEYFISLNSGPQFGFFGDSWQTIYQSNKACGLIQHENIVEIKKGANFRSAPKIVDLLNFIRPELPQRSAIDNFAGEVTVITCDDYIGERRTDRNFKGDLPSSELKERLNEKAKRKIFFEIIFMTYSYVHNAINTEAFPNAIKIYDKNNMTARGRGKYAYKKEIRDEGEDFFRAELNKYFKENRIWYIV